MKSVLFISRTCSRNPGGMQTHTATLISALSARSDLRLRVCCFSGSSMLLPVFFLRALFVALRADVSTVLVADAVLSPLFFFLSIVRPRIRRSAIVHGLDLTWSFPGYRTVIRFALSTAHRIAPVSRYTAALAESLGLPSSQITVIPCPAPPVISYERCVRKSHQILLLGRLVRRKGTVWFLESVLPKLHAQNPEYSIVIAGDGPERERIHQCITRSAIADRIRMIGAVSEHEKNHLLFDSAVLVMPNLHDQYRPEGFGIVCLEAALRGLPVVAAQTDGLLDAVVDGTTGLFFESGSSEGCARTILEACSIQWDAATMHALIQDRCGPAVIASRFIDEVF